MAQGDEEWAVLLSEKIRVTCTKYCSFFLEKSSKWTSHRSLLQAHAVANLRKLIWVHRKHPNRVGAIQIYRSYDFWLPRLIQVAAHASANFYNCWTSLSWLLLLSVRTNHSHSCQRVTNLGGEIYSENAARTACNDQYMIYEVEKMSIWPFPLIAYSVFVRIGNQFANWCLHSSDCMTSVLQGW